MAELLRFLDNEETRHQNEEMENIHIVLHEDDRMDLYWTADNEDFAESAPGRHVID